MVKQDQKALLIPLNASIADLGMLLDRGIGRESGQRRADRRDQTGGPGGGSRNKDPLERKEDTRPLNRWGSGRL